MEQFGKTINQSLTNHRDMTVAQLYRKKQDIFKQERISQTCCTKAGRTLCVKLWHRLDIVASSRIAKDTIRDQYPILE
jgi:hypothetical protein